MKTLFKTAPLVSIAALSIPTAHAEAAQNPKRSIATLSSGIIGGLIAGPAGLFVAGVGGALFDDAEHPESHQVRNKFGVKLVCSTVADMND